MKKTQILVLTLSMMVALIAPALAAQDQEVSQGSYDAIVYVDGSEILAEDSNGQLISSGTAGVDDSSVIQAAVKAISDGTVVLQAGTYTLTSPTELRVSNPDAGTEDPSDAEKAYKAHSVPGRINFADFDLGGEGVAYHDTEAGNQGGYAYRTDNADVDIAERDGVDAPVVSHTYTEEWLQFSGVEVAESGTYTATFYTSTTQDGMYFRVLVDGEDVTTVTVPNTRSWHTFAPTTVEIPLTAGEHTVQIAMETGWVDMAYVDFATEAPTPTPTATPTVTPTPTATATPRPTQTPAPTPGNDEYGAGANPTGNPIGGGEGYTNVISQNDPRVKFVVDTKSELLSALQSARSGDVVYIEGDADIDMSGTYDVRVPGGVTIASNRGENGAPGARLHQDRLSNDKTMMFRIGGENARITGLRLEGPDMTTKWIDGKKIGIYCTYRNFELDNCELSGWGNSAITMGNTGGSDMKTGGYIHHNYFHHCQMDGLGYGVVISAGAVSLIEANYFDYVRHAISGDGEAGDGYEARYNICGPHALATSPHPFDMHGKPNPNGSGTIAGDTIIIHHNTFLATEPSNAYPVAVRGVPRDGAYIYNNWFYYTQAAPVWQTDGREKVYITDNLIGKDGKLSKSGPIKYV
ncbi:carbohydrate-binding protein [Methanoculleus sp.]|uniref:carbohydrate-binding protein n=1 Tax=Methanoculleus sp. TaxID=90427 RepID=UPI0025CDAE1D|nr:carbohydrate-binding protein [Methanoculleus sp.]